MMKNKDKICLATFAVAAFMFMLAGVNSAEDSDAVPTKDLDDEVKIEVTDYSTLRYMLLTDTDGDYLEKGAKIAFVGINRDFGEKVLKIPPKVTYNNVEYEVVGIRANAFKANEDGDPKVSPLRFLETAIFPKTIQVIGITNALLTEDNKGFSFSKCYNLKTIIFEEDSQLRYLAEGSFQDTAIVSFDTSNLTKLKTLRERVPAESGDLADIESKLKYVDISNITDVRSNAFKNCDKIESIVMPKTGNIDNGAFPNVKFYEDDGITEIKGSKLVGKAFKKNADGKMTSAYVATFNTHGGSVPEGEYLVKTYFMGEKLPDIKLNKGEGIEFYQWIYGLEGIDTMPDKDVELHAVYTMGLPNLASLTYNGRPQSPLSFEEDAGYEEVVYRYVTGDKKKTDAGEYHTQIEPKDVYILWKVGEKIASSWSVNWTIEPKPLTKISWTSPADMDLEYSKTAKEPKCKAEGAIGEDTVEVIIGLTDPTMDNINVTYVPFTFTAKGLDNGNYSLPADNLVSDNYTITAKPVTIKGVTIKDHTYDGKTVATIDNYGEVDGVIGDDDVDFDRSSVTATFAQASVGEGIEVTLSGFALTGTEAGNYALSAQPSATGNITPKKLTKISWTAPEDLVYSGSKKELKGSVGEAEGVVQGDTVTVSAEVVVEGSNVNVGTFRFIATGLEGEDGKNYSLPDERLSEGYTIAAKDLSIKADDQEVKVGDPAAPFTVTTVGFVEGEGIKDLYGSLRIDCSYTASSPEGSYSIVPSGVGSNNYLITFENGTLTAKGEQPDPPGPTPTPTPKPPVITVSVKIESSAGGHTSTDSLTVPMNSPVIVNGDKLIIGSSPGATVVRAVAEIGYEFDSWSIEDGRILENTDIYATFKKVSIGGITVKTYPQKTVYNEGDKFDPTGLSIQLTYSDGSAVRVDYEGNESDFSFSPSLDTPLKASDDKVVVTFMGQSAVIKISVSGSEDNMMMFIIVGVIAVIALVAIAAYLLRRQSAY